MSNAKIITGFARMREGELAVRATAVIDSMTDNENFTAPVPALADVNAALVAFKDALAVSLNGGKIPTAFKHEKRRALEDLLYSLALYVQANCRNELSVLISSGFEARRSRAPIGILPKPEKFEVVSGVNPGSIKLRIDKIHGARTYFFEYTSAPVSDTAPWTLISTTTRTCLIENLTSGKQYAFRVAGVGTNRLRVYSDVVNRFVH